MLYTLGQMSEDVVHCETSCGIEGGDLMIHVAFKKI